ncbi:MAG: MBL fold metallo-hydrolase [Candidatus Promineifilaceae bacterium]
MAVLLPPNQISAVILGIMQDAGLPHIGCRCQRCLQAIENHAPEYAACLGIVDRRSDPPTVWLIDATPDIRHQLFLLHPYLGTNPERPTRLRQPDAIFLTHAHMGHTAGLAELGPEGMAVKELPVYASAGLVEILEQTRLWQPLVGNLQLNTLLPGEPLTLVPGLTLTPIPVPHRDELGAGTFAFKIQGPSQSLLYLPDIDKWELWPEARETLSGVDVVLADASFYSTAEVGGRSIAVHPMVPETLAFFTDLPCQLILTHLNHTNPVLDQGSIEREMVESSGTAVAYTGQLFSL